MDLKGIATGGVAITPSNTGTHEYEGLFIGVGGDIKVDMVDGSTPTFLNVGNGMFLPIAVKRVYSTGTTATNIIGLTVGEGTS